MPIIELAKRSGKNTDTVSEAMKKLAEFELAAKSGSKWVKGSADVNEVAEELGAKELAEQRRAKHQEEREKYAEHLEQHKDFYAHLLALDYEVPDDAYMPTFPKRTDDY